MKELSIEEKAKRYDEAIEKAKSKVKNDKDHVLYEDDILDIFPELKESEDEKTKKVLHSIANKMIQHLRDIFSEEEFQCYDAWSNAWLEKQDKNKDLLPVTDRETLDEYAYQVAYDLSNDWMKDTPTWDDVETAVKLGAKWLEKQGEQNSADKVEPKFHVGDWVAINPELRFASPLCIKDIDNNNYLVETVNGDSGAPTIDYLDNHYHLWTIQDAKDGDVLATDSWLYMFKYTNNKALIQFHCKCPINGKTYKWSFLSDDSYLDIYIDANIHPATKEQHDLLFQKMKEAGYEWDAEKKELRKVEQKLINKIQPKFKVGDIIKNKKNGDTVKVEQILSDSYCYYGWDGAATIHSDFLISDQGNWELVEQKPAGNEMIEILRTEYEKGRADAITEFQKEWSEEDEKNYDILLKIICSSNKSEELVDKLYDWFKSIKDRVQPWNLIITDEELAQAKKDAYNDALDKIEYHSGEPTFDDGWSAAIWYFKKRNIQPQPKQEWSEEDNDMLDKVIHRIEQLDHYWNKPTDEKMIDWLKSLKDKVQPKPKEWCEEDEEIYRKCICAMRASACGFPEEEKFVEQVDNWLKSLKDRYTWKPSDEQMEALESLLGLMNSKSIYGKGLVSLLKQLKKLREE